MTEKDKNTNNQKENPPIITPWSVKGNIDYEKIIKQFGLKRINKTILDKLKKLTKGELHYFLTREIFFVHRDLDLILNDLEQGKEVVLYTGRGPSGKTHIGHIIPWLLTKWLQDKLKLKLIFQITDDEKFLFKEKSFEEIQEHTYENILDIIAIGFDPKLTKIIIDTKHINYIYEHALKIAKKINFSTVKAVFGFTNEANIGQIFFTSIQAVPAMLPSAIHKKNIRVLIPCAIDQDPHFRIARDVLPKLGYYKPSLIESKFFPSLKGLEENKMSSSDENYTIFLDDSPKEVKRKIMKYAFSGGRATIEEHRKLGGIPEIDVSYQYLYFLEEDDNKLKKIYHEYKSGKMLTGELKKITIEKINQLLKKFRENREKVKEKWKEYLFNGYI